MNKATKQQTDIEFFKQKLKLYKDLLDKDIADYSRQVQKTTLSKFGAHSRIATDSYLEILARGGKRIRGTLAMIGYEMTGGKDTNMILQAARAVEMVHAYILIIDDINDRSPIRRGGDTAHILMSKYHAKKNWADESHHFGESIAMNAALIGNHSANCTLANLDADPQLRLKAISTLNYGMVTTAHGQFNDIFNEVTSDVTEADVMNVMEWKTAHYSFLNPLTFGMVLAGADCGPTDAIAQYSLNVGRAFQITDDILGTFGVEFESGKSPLDDIKEGKRTLLSVYALEHGTKADKNFLIQMLGNHKLTPEQFNRCKDILVETGALEYAKNKAQSCINDATTSLSKNQKHWSPEGTKFLSGLAQSLIDRRT
jgi:geranylgeranyl diphosphate synthase, type I